MRFQGSSPPAPAVSLDAADDASLVAAAAAGDKAGVAELYARYAPILLAVGTRILGDRPEAEDVLHDVFLEAWLGAATYDVTRGSVRAWLVLRMRSRTLDRLRAPGVARVVQLPRPDQGADRLLPFVAGDELSFDRARVKRTLDDLPAEQRAVIDLSYFHGLSSSEMAARLGIPIGTVKSRIAAAMNRLRQVLGAPFGSPRDN